jgi:hypothetical protein
VEAASQVFPECDEPRTYGAASEFAFATFQEIASAVSDKPFEEIEEESSRLAESLKSCRSVVNDYRVILTGNHAVPSSEESDSDARE